MRPLISYYGGKQRLVHSIVKLIPQHRVYVEPFCGGASVLFGKPYFNIPYKNSYIEVINDLDSNLINFYRCFQDKEKQKILLNKLTYTKYSIEEWNKAWEILTKKGNYIDIDKAWAYFVHIMQGFSYIVNINKGSSWGNSRYTNNAYIWQNIIATLSPCIDRLKNVTIDHRDALEVIKMWDSPHTFFYCDPPYIGREQKYNTPEYTNKELKKLVATLNECKGSFILSGYNTDLVPREWERFEFNRKCMSFNQKDFLNADSSRTEIVWRRFNTERMRSDIQRLCNRVDCFVRHPEFNSAIVILQDSIL